MSALYIVSTPIGNLDDLSARAVSVLQSVTRVLAEDTRHTAILFRRYGISTPLVSAHEHNEAARAQQLLSWLDAGDDVALVTDAGTPLLSDPGARLVTAVIEAGHEAVPIPGPSALLAALVVSGLPVEPFTFFGFAPRTGRARSELFAQLSALRHTAVLYESPARLNALLAELEAVCGTERHVAVARELTKLHETVFRGTLAAARAYYESAPARGEVVVVLGGAAEPAVDVADAAELARELVAAGQTPKSAAQELARRLRMSRNEAYALVQTVTRQADRE